MNQISATVGQVGPKVYRVSLGRGDENWRPELFPGSDDAFEAGCTCPVEQPWPGGFAFAFDCPLHQLERRQDA